MRCKAPKLCRSDPDDPGKLRYCELKPGHKSCHWTVYCGKNYYWENKDETEVKHLHGLRSPTGQD